jgi:hypothetical protein
MATRGVIENSTLVGFSNINFRDLFYATTQQYSNFWAKIDKNYCYCFELTSPENRIVTVYTERRLHLLTMRSVASWEEVTPEGLLGNAELLGVSLPSRTVFNGDRDSLLELAKKLATLQEGFVAVDYTKKDSDGISFKRLKIKNPSYVAIHHLKNRAGRSLRSLASLVYDCQTDEFLGYFQEFKPFIDSVQKSYDEYRVSIQQEVESLQEFFNQNRTAETRKAFALKVCKSKNAAFLFQLYDGRVKSLSEFLNMLEKTKTRKYLEKYLVEQLKLKDQNIYSVEE